MERGCFNCAHKDDNEWQFRCVTCAYDGYFLWKEKNETNADKYFRHATDEELARFLAKAQADILRTVGRALKYPGDLVRDCDLEDAADDWLYWLKQEVESDGE